MSGYAESAGKSVIPATDFDAADLMRGLGIKIGQAVELDDGGFMPMIELVRLAITYGKSEQKGRL